MLSFSKRGREETRVGTLGKSSLFVTSPDSHAELARFLACPAKGQSNVCHLHRSYDLYMRENFAYIRSIKSTFTYQLFVFTLTMNNRTIFGLSFAFL